jgi:DNA-binding FadR family transcriptional regulator
LERYVGSLAIQRIAEKEVEELEKIALEMEVLAGGGKEYEVVMKDMEFHTRLVKITRNSQLEKIMNFIYNECLRIWFISHYKEINESVKMHFETVEVLRKGDRELLDMDIIRHNLVFRERVNNYFQKLLSNGNRSVGEFKVDITINSHSPSGTLTPIAG